MGLEGTHNVVFVYPDFWDEITPPAPLQDLQEIKILTLKFTVFWIR